MLTYANVIAIIADIDYKNWSFQLFDSHGHWFLQLVVPASDTYNNQEWKSRKWYISPHMVKSEVVQTAFLAVKTAEEHEMREQFRYLGEAIFGPHIDSYALHAVAKVVDVRK